MSDRTWEDIGNEIRDDYLRDGGPENVRFREVQWEVWIAEVERAAAARALEEAANTWTQGAWSDHTPPRDAIRPQIILGMAQGAGDWLRARAAEMRGAKSDE